MPTVTPWYATVDATKKHRLGRRRTDIAGNEYIYLKGVNSCVAKDAVYFSSDFVAVRLVVDKAAAVAVAMAAVDAATKYGWFQIYGVGSVNSDTVAGANLPLYVDGTAGRVDDATSAGDLISGMFSMGADATNVLAVFMTYPFVQHSGYLT